MGQSTSEGRAARFSAAPVALRCQSALATASARSAIFARNQPFDDVVARLRDEQQQAAGHRQKKSRNRPGMKVGGHVTTAKGCDVHRDDRPDEKRDAQDVARVDERIHPPRRLQRLGQRRGFQKGGKLGQTRSG